MTVTTINNFMSNYHRSKEAAEYNPDHQPEHDRLVQYHDELLVEFVIHRRKEPFLKKNIQKHRSMEDQLVSWFGRSVFWLKTSQLTEILTMTGAIDP